MLIFSSLFIPGLLNFGVKQAADCSIYILCGLRLLQGFFQGWIFPAETIIWGRHCDKNEQTFFSGLAMSSMYFGIVISTLMTPIIIMATSWVFFFDLVGLLAVVWSLAWYFMFYWKAIDRKYGKSDLSEQLSALPVLKSIQFWISSMGQIIMSALVILLTGSIPKFLFQVYNSPRNRFLGHVYRRSLTDKNREKWLITCSIIFCIHNCCFNVVNILSTD